MVYNPATLLAAYVADALEKLSVIHPTLHADDREELRGIKTAIGLNLSGVPARGKALIGSGDGTSIWDAHARKNRLINGDMRIAQRAMPTADDQYCLDRWNLLLEAANAAIPSQEASDVPTDGSKRALKLTVGSGEDNKFGVVQFVEFLDCADLRGKLVSLQFKAKATAGITNVRTMVAEWTGTADTLTSDIVNVWGAATVNPTLVTNWANIGVASHNVTTSWATYYHEEMLVGASANNLAVFVWCDDETTTVTTDILRITDIQLEEGAVCTAFERRPFTQELMYCRRYYFKTFPQGVTPTQNSGVLTDCLEYVSTLAAPGTQGVGIRFPVAMRAAPTITYFNPSAANTNWRNATLAADSGAPVTLRLNHGAVFTLNTHTGSDAASHDMLIHLTAEAEL